MALTAPIIKQDYTTHKGKKLYFYIIMSDGRKLNLLTLPNIHILSDGFEFSFKNNAHRSFTFSFTINELYDKSDELLGENWNEIQILEDNTKIIFDGIIHKNTLSENNYAQIEKHRVEVVGTEFQYTTSFVKGLTTYVNLTSQEILTRVGAQYGLLWDQGFTPPEFHNPLEEKWTEALNIDGQYSRLFDTIKDREHAVYKYDTNGKIIWAKEDKLAFGNPVRMSDITTVPMIDHLNETKVDRVSYKFRDIRGALIRESIKPNESDKSIKTIEAVYDVKSIAVDGDKSFTKNLGQSGKDQKTYSFNGNELSFTGVEDVSNVDIQYWQLEQNGVVQYDDEKSIVGELKRRDKSGTIFEQEISSERVGDIRDVYSSSKKFVDFVNRPQYKINWTVIDASADIDYLNDWVDLKRYKWDDPKYFQYAKKANYYMVHEKTYKLRVNNSCDGEYIDLENFKVDILFESDQSNRWENSYQRDKTQGKRREQNTININLHHDWDIGTAAVKGGEIFNKNNLITQTVGVNAQDAVPRNHVPTNEKVITEKLHQYLPKADVIDCLKGNRAYLRGYVFYKANLPKSDRSSNDRFIYMETGGEAEGLALLNKDYSLYKLGVPLEVWIYSKSADNWFRYIGTPDLRPDANGVGHYVWHTGPVEMKDYWIKIPVDARIFNPGTDNIAATWNLPTEWGFTGWDGSHRIHQFYIDPFTLKGSPYPIHDSQWVSLGNQIPLANPQIMAVNYGQHSPEYGTYNKFVIPESEVSNKFEHYAGDWYTSLVNNPHDLFDDKKCNIQANHKTPVAVDSKTGVSSATNWKDNVLKAPVVAGHVVPGTNRG